MKYAYPALFTKLPSGEYDVRIPDLPGLVTCGKDLSDASEMAADAAAMWLCDAEDNHEEIPEPSDPAAFDHSEWPDKFVAIVPVDTDKYRRESDKR